MDLDEAIQIVEAYLYNGTESIYLNDAWYAILDHVKEENK